MRNGGVSCAFSATASIATRHSSTGYLASQLWGSHTPLYASPQQQRGDAPDPRDDVHALGVIWYQLLTGDLTAGRPGGTRWVRRLAEQGVPPAQVDLLGSCFEDNPAVYREGIFTADLDGSDPQPFLIVGPEYEISFFDIAPGAVTAHR